MPGQLALKVDLRHYCGSCPLEAVCDPRDLLPCQPRFGDPGYGGPNVLHPARPDLGAYLEEVGGGGLGDIEVRQQKLQILPVLMPRVRARRALRGQLDRDFYAVGPDQVVVGRRSVLAADDLREMLGLRPDQRLALTLFGADPAMEFLWAGRGRIATEIAEAGYDLVTSPSFSARVNHPPAEFLYNLKRSFVYFSMLQWAGVPVVPRLAWLCDADADRVAVWSAAQTHLRMVALDMAVKQQGEWVRQVGLLRRFDLATDGRLRFLIHGPAVGHRLQELFEILGSRIHLTGSGAIARPYACAGRFGSYVDEEERIIDESRSALQLESTPDWRSTNDATVGIYTDSVERLAA